MQRVHAPSPMLCAAAHGQSNLNNRIWALLALLASAQSGVVMATEQVPYVVERALSDNVEVRRYDATIVAETVIDAQSYADAGNEGFRRLAGYIFGDNASRDKVAMTAPVAMTAAASSEKIAMTAPVAVVADGAGWRMAFYMPAGYTLTTLPRPLDARVVLRTVPARRVAALRFSGRGTADQFAARTEELRATLAAAGLQTQGEPWTARYNAPWVLPLLRRNEAMIELAAAAQ